MKTLFQYVVLLSVFFLPSCSGNVATNEASPPAENTADRIEVLDFHTDHRCQTCVTIEELTRTILTEHYTTEMEAGQITFQLINVDEDGNFPIAQKFGAFGTSLILNVILDGQEKHVDLTDFAFMNAGDEEKFTQGFQEMINTELKHLQL